MVCPLSQSPELLPHLPTRFGEWWVQVASRKLLVGLPSLASGWRVHQSRRLVYTALRVPEIAIDGRFIRVPLRLREQRFSVIAEFFDTFADVIEGPVAAGFARGLLEDLGIPASS